jgi:hypothetical protein
VDKRAAMRAAPRDPAAADARDTVTRLAVRNGLSAYGGSGFGGYGQRTDAGTPPWYPLLGFRR